MSSVSAAPDVSDIIPGINPDGSIVVWLLARDPEDFMMENFFRRCLRTVVSIFAENKTLMVQNVAFYAVPSCAAVFGKRFMIKPSKNDSLASWIELSTPQI